MAAAAAKTVECLGVVRGERLGVPCNPRTRRIADAIADAGRAVGAESEVLEFPEVTRHGEEPPEYVAQALLSVDAVAAPTLFSISHTQARIAASERGVRVASMPGIDEDIFKRVMIVDYEALKTEGDMLARLLTGASSCRIRTRRGTDVTLYLEGRSGRNDDGDLRSRGAFGNLPAGEAYIAPIEDSGSGVIVFDGSVAGFGLLEEPLTVTLEDGRAVDAHGPKADPFLAMLDAGGKTGRNVAEFAIGTNTSARVHGQILEDEKVAGTIHIAFGTSAGIGGVNVSSVHIDGLVTKPDVSLDVTEIMSEGRTTV